MLKAIAVAPPSNTNAVRAARRSAQQSGPMPEIDAPRQTISLIALHDHHNAGIMPMPRHHASHRDCRRLLIQIAALHPATERGYPFRAATAYTRIASGRAGHDLVATIKARIDSGVPCPIGLVYTNTDVWNQHQLLV